MEAVEKKERFDFVFGTTKAGISIEWDGRRLNVEFDVAPPEDKVFYHRKKSKPYKPYIGSYSVKNTIDFYIALRAMLLRDGSYAFHEFNNKGVKGSRTFRMLLNSPSAKSAYGIIKDYVSSLNGDNGRFIDNVKSFMNKTLSEEDERKQYKIFSQNYKKDMMKANFGQFSSFLEDAYKNVSSYSPEQFSLKEIFNAFYPYQQAVFEFMYTAEEPRYTLLYIDYYILDAIREEIEEVLESVNERKVSIYGKQRTEKSPIPVLVVEKKDEEREISLFPAGTSGTLSGTEYKLFKKALDYYINTGIAPRLMTKSGIGLMGGKNSVVLIVGGKPFDISSRKEAANLMFNIL